MCNARENGVDTRARATIGGGGDGGGGSGGGGGGARAGENANPPRRDPAPARDHVSARSRYAIRAGTLVEWKNVPIDAADDDDDAVRDSDCLSSPTAPQPMPIHRRSLSHTFQ